jgi:hypothetical protein
MDYEKILAAAAKIEDLARSGCSKDVIKSRVRGFSDELFSIARARMKNAKERKIDPDFIFDEDDLRFCTNMHVAGYRASRLKCGKIVDVGCGIGIQAIEFAKTCGRVIAIDTDAHKLEYAKMNAAAAGVSNIEFVHADALDALGNVKKADMVFWDPERPEGESERSLDSLNPSFKELFSAAERITTDIAVELPPQIERSKIGADCELEYISVDGRLNRLVAYFGKLKKSDVSVVALPSGGCFEQSGSAAKSRSVRDFSDYLYEVDAAIVKSGLLDSFVSSIKDAFIVFFGSKNYVTSKRRINSAFLKPYKVAGIIQVDEVKEFLANNKFGHAVPHGSIDEKEYSLIRRKLESGLQGDASAHVFIAGDKAVVAVKV